MNELAFTILAMQMLATVALAIAAFGIWANLKK